jgi:murein DD-endopeptidase MepM/ murein hydrolase activator NlpD
VDDAQKPGAQRTDAQKSGTGKSAAQKSDVQKSEPRRSAPTDVPTRREGYTVVSGDSLSRITVDQHLAGSWQKVYEDNRKVVGDDPDLIFPGQRLVLHVPKTPTATSRPGATASRTGDTQAKQAHEAGPEPTHTAGSAPARPAPAQQTQKPQRPQTQHFKSRHTRAQHPDTNPGHTQKQTAHTEKKAVAHHTAPKPTAPGVEAPVRAAIGTPYRASGSSWSSGAHTGVDFLVPTGTSVKAVEAGTVVTAGWGGAYGYQVVIRHPDGKYSQYGHLSAITVRVGQKVGEGQRIARSGSTGNATGPHLHFEMRTGPAYGSDIDPLAYLRSHGVHI